MTSGASSSTLFDAATVRAVELGDDDIPLLQRFFERNPDYFLSVNGEGPGADEARDELHSPLPEGWPFSWQRSIGFVDGGGNLIGMANVVADLLANGVWHIGLFKAMGARSAAGQDAGTSMSGCASASRWASARTMCASWRSR
jgi:hypothetical protein